MFGASTRADARGPRLMLIEEPPTEGTLSGLPSSATNFNCKEAGLALIFVKYKAEYQPPPKGKWGRIYVSGLEAEVYLMFLTRRFWVCGPLKFSSARTYTAFKFVGGLNCERGIDTVCH